MKISRQVGTVSEILGVFIQDATVSTGAGLANIIGSTVNFTWIRNNQAVASTGVASTAATTGTFSTSGFTQVNSSQAKGMYHFCPPDGLFTSGGSAMLLIYGTTGVAASMAPLPIEVELTKINNQQYASSTAFGSVLSPVNASTVSGLVGVSTLTVGVNATTVSGLAGVSTLTTGVNATTVSGLAGVSTITLGAASTITQGVNATTGTLTVGLVGVSTITLSAASTITQGVNATTGTLSVGLVGVSSITLGAASTITGGVNVTNMASSTLKFATVDPGAWPLWGIIDSGVAQSTTANTIDLRAAFNASTSVLVGSTILIYSATVGQWERRLVTSWTTATDQAGVDAWSGANPDNTASYIVFATPPGSASLPPAVNLTQIYGTPAVTTAGGTLGVANAGLVGVSTITLSAASTITQGVNATTVSGLVGVSTIAAAVTTKANIVQIQGQNAVTTVSGILSTGLIGVSTLTVGVNATTVSGLAGVSTITLGAASTITQGVNATTGTLSVGLVGVSTITLAAASTITQGVNVTSGALNGLVGVSTITCGVNATTVSDKTGYALSAAERGTLSGVILSTTQAESFRASSAAGSIVQLMYEAVANLTEFTNSGTTRTLNSVTSHAGGVAVYQYNSTTPSAITRIG